jgi:hypothetical protein
MPIALCLKARFLQLENLYIKYKGGNYDVFLDKIQKT